MGYKGYALSLLVEILGGTLAGSVVDDPQRLGNGLCLIVINPAAFTPLGDFKELMEGVGAYMKSAAPAEGFDEVMLPGEKEFQTVARRQAEGIPLADTTWKQITEVAKRLGVPIQER